MKINRLTKLFFLVLLFILMNGIVNAQDFNTIKLNKTYQNRPLKEFLENLKTENGIKVFYKDSWIESYTINKNFENVPLLQALNNIFYEHDLTYEIFQDNVLVVYKRTMDKRSRFDNAAQFIIVGNTINIGRFKEATITGRVLDGKTGEPLIGAVIYNTKQQKGVTTNKLGAFEINLPTGDHQMDLSYIGFQNSRVKIRLIESGSVDLQLFEETHNIQEVTIIGEDSDLPEAQMGMVQMTSKELKQLPALMGEVDVLKGLTMQAGVQTVGELSSGFNVRGGNTDQNLLLVNGSPVFNASHLFGFLSLINPDVVEDVRLFKGGMPVKYGERVASVMEVDFKDGNDELLRAYGGIGLINSRLTLDGPLTKDKKLTMVAGGRSSYTDWILKKLPDLDLSESVTKFYDVSGKLSYKFNQHNKISLMGYASNDEFSTSSQSVTEYGNLLGNFKLHTSFGEKLSGELEASYSEYDYRLTDYTDEKPTEAYYLDNKLEYSSGSYLLKYHPTPRHNAEAGFKVVYNKISPGEITPVNDLTVIDAQIMNDEKMMEWAAFIGDEFQILPHFSVVAGLRYSGFRNIGTPVVYLYDDTETLSPENVVGSLKFGSNEASATYGGFEPRFSMHYDLNNSTTLKFNYQRVRQYVFQLSNNAVISPAETWKAADYHLKPLISDQIAVGVENDSWLKDVDFEAEVYYKRLQNLIEYKNGAQLIMNEHIETALIPTNGFSYGIELSAQKKTGRLTGFASYVYSRTKRRNESQFDEENFWDGKYYPSIYDKPHDFSLNATYNISRRWRFSGNFVFISGRPTTLPEIKYSYAGEDLVYYSERNKYRMPPYHRLDLSITFDENLRKKRMWKGSWTLSVYNVYSRNNPYSVYYKKSTPNQNNDYRRYSLYKLSVIGIPIPSLTYNFRF